MWSRRPVRPSMWAAAVICWLIDGFPASGAVATCSVWPTSRGVPAPTTMPGTWFPTEEALGRRVWISTLRNTPSCPDPKRVSSGSRCPTRLPFCRGSGIALLPSAASIRGSTRVPSAVTRVTWLPVCGLASRFTLRESPGWPPATTRFSPDATRSCPAPFWSPRRKAN